MIVRLTRFAERGERVPLEPLIFCLEHLQRLEFGGEDGATLLWLVAPVLRAALAELAKVNEERQVLETEVSNLRPHAETVAMEAEGQNAWFQRAEASVETWLRDKRLAIEELTLEGKRLAQELKEVEAEGLTIVHQLDGGLQSEREAWELERPRLEEEVVRLRSSLATLERELTHDLVEPSLRAQEQLVEATSKLRTLSPRVLKQEELRKKLAEREVQVEDIQQQLEALMEARRNKHKKKKRKPPPARPASSPSSKPGQRTKGASGQRRASSKSSPSRSLSRSPSRSPRRASRRQGKAADPDPPASESPGPPPESGHEVAAVEQDVQPPC